MRNQIRGVRERKKVIYIFNFHLIIVQSGRQMYVRESDNTKFNTPALHSHLRPCNTNESHDTGERKGLIGPNLDMFT